MTTRGGEAKPAERTAAEAETAAGSDPSSRAVTSGDAEKTAPLSGTVAAPPDDARRLELEIERTREQLGQTVQELFARADVKGRTLAKASEVSGRCKSTVVEARKRAATSAAPAWEAMPEQVRRAVTKGASGARQHWMPLAMAAGVVIIGCLAVRYGRCDR